MGKGEEEIDKKIKNMSIVEFLRSDEWTLLDDGADGEDGPTAAREGRGEGGVTQLGKCDHISILLDKISLKDRRGKMWEEKREEAKEENWRRQSMDRHTPSLPTAS